MSQEMPKLKVGDMIENKTRGRWNDMSGTIFILANIGCDRVIDYPFYYHLYSIEDMKYIDFTISYIDSCITEKTWEIL